MSADDDGFRFNDRTRRLLLLSHQEETVVCLEDLIRSEIARAFARGFAAGEKRATR